MNLSDYRPNNDMTQDIKRELMNAGIDSGDIPMDWLEAIVAATFKWVATKPDGLRQVSALLGGAWERGKSNKTYSIDGKEVSHDEVFMMKALLAKGRVTSFGRLKVEDVAKVRCDECGTSSHCVKDIYSYRRDRTDSFCNACLVQTDDLRMRDHGDMGMCDTCPDTTCVHNYIHLRRKP